MFEQKLNGAIIPLIHSMGQGLAAAAVDSVIFGESFEDMINQLAKAALREAAIGAALEGAKALAMTAMGFATGNPMYFAAAKAHGLAAAAYAGVAGVAGVAAAASGGVRSGDEGGAGGATASPTARDIGGTGDGGDGGPSTITILANFNGQPLHTRADIQDAIASALDASTLRRGRVRVDFSRLQSRR
jgi:hypothetical protein